jgi:AcrR family transcriptional regulator
MAGSRTRDAIVESFKGMFPERPYDEIRVADIIEGAGVGRSTFYEHFRGKDEVFRQAAEWLLHVLADAATPEGDVARIRHVVEHLRDNRRVARERLAGDPGRQFARWIADAIEPRIAATLVPAPMAATAIATAQVALLRAWLDARDPCPSAALAAAIVRMSRAMASAVIPR